ncbi:methionine aminopeptidase [Mycobacterium tuberculosis]|nr:methionine aminopeptidase [Mycobacterium tuberculosis]
MLSAFISSLRTVDLRRKILFTLGIVILYRVGAALPSPGVNFPNVQQCIKEASAGEAGQIYSLINLFSGGALLKLTVFAVGVMPYITASIIVQLLTVVIPRFEELRKEGQAGQSKMTQYTRYLAIALAILQATSIVALAANGGLLQGCSLDIIADQSIFTLVVIVLVMTGGAALVMWMGELITERGIGNGMSLLIFVAAALRAIRAAAAPGTSSLSLDEIAESVIRESGATPSFLGYHGYPASICASINDRVVHGIPSTAEVLAPGDLVSIDCGAVLDGWHGDAAITFGVGALSDADEALSEATRESLQAGIAAMVVGNRLTDVAHAIETGTRAAELRYGRSFGIVAGYGGHGIGRQMHMDPFLPNEGAPGRGPLLAAGSVLAIEPMLTLGTTKTVVLDDKWTVTTADGSRAAHWEHTVAVTDDGPRILTLG